MSGVTMTEMCPGSSGPAAPKTVRQHRDGNQKGSCPTCGKDVGVYWGTTTLRPHKPAKPAGGA